MSSLHTTDRVPFERLFDMSGGYVLDFTNDSFKQFVEEAVGKDIYSHKYASYGNSKAKRLRTFIALESDHIVGQLLERMLQYEVAKSDDLSDERNQLRACCAQKVHKLLGREPDVFTSESKEVEFLHEDFSDVSLSDVPIEGSVAELLENRLTEARSCFASKAYLSVVILCGSILEGVLLGTAIQSPQQFNEAEAAPRDSNRKVKKFRDWSLSNFIDVATDIGKLSLDVKLYGHTLRGFRNYVHPYEQMASGFHPDAHTARISLQVLNAAIADLSGQRERK